MNGMTSKSSGEAVIVLHVPGSIGDQMRESPFENIESAHEYVGLLLDEVTDAQDQVREHMESRSDHGPRQLEALQLVAYKLSRLDQYLKSSRLILNDLRSLRMLLFEERERVRLRA
jgi:hypothetical protein